MSRNVTYIDRDLCSSPFFVGLVRSEKAFKAELKRLKIPQENWPGWVERGSDAHFVTVEEPTTGGKLGFVCLNCDADAEDILGILTHEATHVWQEICEDIGETNPSSEFEAYALQNISKRLISAWLAGDKKKRGKK